MSEKYNVKRLRDDLKKNVGSEGLNEKHLHMSDTQLISDYGYIYGEEALKEYLLSSEVAVKEEISFEIIIRSVRVDLGGELFIDASEAKNRIFKKGPHITFLGWQILNFIKERNGQIIDITGPRFTFDTGDLTIVAEWIKESGKISKQELADIKRTLKGF